MFGGHGFNVVAFGNSLNEQVDDTILMTPYDSPVEETLELLPSLTFGEILKETPEEYSLENWDTEADIIIELGDDFVEFYYDHDERFYVGFY